MNTLFDKNNLLIIRQILWTYLVSKHNQQKQNLTCAIFCSQAWNQIFNLQRRKSMGIPAKKGYYVEVDLTTEIVQDGMLFIAYIYC